MTDAPHPESLRRTSLYERHVGAGGRLVPFAGWEMPVQYSGVAEEHMAVRTRAGLFDVSHMGEVFVEGRGALATLQRLTSNDVARLAVGQAQYSALTTPAGTFVDDVLVHRLADERFFLCVNASNARKDFEWIAARAERASVTDRSDAFAQLAVQGPAAASIVQKLADRDLSSLRSYWFYEGKIGQVRAIVARTGYTGEDGFELYVPAEEGPGVWDAVLDAGRGEGLVPAGLGARDTLRLEAKMALYGNDIDETTTVLEADLLFILKLGKGEFLGREVLAGQRASGVPRRLVGFELREPGIARHGHEIRVEGRPAGTVTSGTQTPFLKKSIGLAYLPSGHDRPGSRFEVVVRGRPLSAEVISDTLLQEDTMNAPEELLYSKDHEWVRRDGASATIGITDFAQSELGDIVFVELPEIGAVLEAGKEIGTVESVKAVSEVFSPVSGEVTEVNESLRDAPESINTDPYGAGWILKVRLTKPDETKDLLSAADYARFVSSVNAP